MVSVRAGNEAYATKLCFDSPTSASTSCGTAAPTNTGPEADSAETVTGAFTRLRTFGPRTRGALEEAWKAAVPFGPRTKANQAPNTARARPRRAATATARRRASTTGEGPVEVMDGARQHAASGVRSGTGVHHDIRAWAETNP